MRCIFCKEESSSSKSVEHIIPESLGGKSHILKQGIVCDKCNNYFAREIEKPFQEHSSIKALRFDEGLISKKGIIPPMQAVLNQKYEVKLWKDTKGSFAGHIDVETEAFQSIMSNEKGIITFPVCCDTTTLREGAMLSRFLGKVAIESFAYRIIESSTPEMLDSFVDDDYFITLKNHVRRGVIKDWPCSVRRIYDAKKRWSDTVTGEAYQVMNEFDFLLTEEFECYFVLALFGMEYIINMGVPSIEGIERWLENHKNESPLYYNRKSPGHYL